MIKEAIYRSPKWMRNFLDFEVATGADIKGEPSERQKSKKIENEWNKRWQSVNEEDFKNFYEDVYRDETKKYHNGYVWTNDLRKIKERHMGDMSIWEKFDKWLVEKKKKEEDKKRIERDINKLYDDIFNDFNANPFFDKIETPFINGRMIYIYHFENGDKVTLDNNTLKYETKTNTVTCEFGLVYRAKFKALFNNIVKHVNETKYKRNSSNSGYSSSKSEKSNKATSSNPKREKYDTLNDKIKLREEQLKKMKKTDSDYEVLKNELDAYKRIRDKMKDNHKFEHIVSFSKYNRV
jgi:hypothetical protein